MQAKHPDRKPRILTITQSTYDGILYNVEQLRTMLDGRIGTLHFDEAWLPHAAFHHFYKDMHAIGPNRPQPEESMIFATHSTHKLLAGISQASQILVREPLNKKLDRHTFNEAYLMHSSTSPQYAIIASCDVAAAMMEPPAEPHWSRNRSWKRSISDAPCGKSTTNGAPTGGSKSGT